MQVIDYQVMNSLKSIKPFSSESISLTVFSIFASSHTMSSEANSVPNSVCKVATIQKEGGTACELELNADCVSLAAVLVVY